jgi:hypothetical protein
LLLAGGGMERRREVSSLVDRGRRLLGGSQAEAHSPAGRAAVRIKPSGEVLTGEGVTIVLISNYTMPILGGLRLHRKSEEQLFHGKKISLRMQNPEN